MSNSEETFANFVQSEEDRQAFQDRLDQEDRIEAIAKAMKKADEEDKASVVEKPVLPKAAVMT